MSDEEKPVANAAKAAPKKAAPKKTSAAASNGAKPAPAKRKPAAKKPATDGVAAPAAAAVAAVATAPAEATSVLNTAAARGASALSVASSKVSAMMPDNMGEKAKEVASEVKDKASDAVEGLAKLIHDSASAIDDNVGPKYGDYARTAAQTVTDAADRLRAKPVEEIAEDTKEFVRNKPGTALGIAAVTSLVLAKIVSVLFGKRR